MSFLDRLTEIKSLLHKVADVLGSALDVFLSFKKTFGKKEEIEDDKEKIDTIEE